MRMPNFLIIGAPKAGTTALYFYLKQHPQIYMSPKKELHFFCFESGEQIHYRGPGDRKAAVSHAPKTLEEYLSHFEGATDEIAVGEASPFYLYFPKSAQRIYETIPDAKLVAILRNPVDRAYSGFLNKRREGKEPIADFAEALKAEPKRIRENWGPLYHYKQVGFYYEQVQRFFDRFDREQIKIYLYEDLSNDANGLIQDLFRFLGVDDTFVPELSTKYNISGLPKSKTVHTIRSFLKRPHPAFHAVTKRVVPKRVRSFFHQLVSELIRRIDSKNLARSVCPPEIRRQLLEEYREDILKLQDLIQRDLSHWLREK